MDFCTYFDSNYLLQGLTLFRSLEKHTPQSRLFVLCLDNNVYIVLNNLANPHLIPISLSAIEADYPELLSIKASRTVIEYYFTLTPFLPSFIMKDSNISSITYVDADLYFYSDPASLYKDFVKYSILITPHRFPAELRHLEVYGIFNVSFMIFRNDTLGHACLALYRQACINWCYDRLEDNRFADQKYLDSWPNLFTQGLLINDHVGAGLAPWNWFQYKIRNSSKGDGFLVEEAPLVFYHFHGLKFIFPHLVWTGLNDYNSKESSKQLKAIYRVYVQALRQTEVFLKQYQQKIEFSDLRSNRSVLNMLKKSLIRNDVWWI